MTDHSNASNNYERTFGILIVSLVASIVLAEFVSAAWGIAVIFVIAFYKAYLVVSRFMHLSVEPRGLKVAIGITCLALLVLFAGFYPDIVIMFGGGSP